MYFKILFVRGAHYHLLLLELFLCTYRHKLRYVLSCQKCVAGVDVTENPILAAWAIHWIRIATIRITTLSSPKYNLHAWAPPQKWKHCVYWAVEQLAADCAPCNRFVMKDMKPVLQIHLKHLKKIAQTPSNAPAVAEQNKAVSVIKKTGFH